MPINPRPIEDRFWEKVNKRGRIVRPGLGHCWEFLGRPTANGYMRIKRADKVTIYVHRFSWELHEGPIRDGLLVCHKCDNKPCVRPTHLFLGTEADNAQDMLKKGRANKATGERHGNAKLTEADVLRLLRMHASGKYSRIDLVVEFRICEMQVSRIVRGERWAHLQR